MVEVSLSRRLGSVGTAVGATGAAATALGAGAGAGAVGVGGGTEVSSIAGDVVGMGGMGRGLDTTSISLPSDAVLEEGVVVRAGGDCTMAVVVC